MILFCLDKRNIKIMFMTEKICFIGGGNMAQAMIAGLVNKGFIAQNITVVDRNKSKCDFLKSRYKIKLLDNVSKAITESNILILAIKPQQMLELIASIKDDVTPEHLIITVAAGIQVFIYEKIFSKEIVLARVMPNMPSRVGYGATGIYFNKNINLKHRDIVTKIMQAIGIAVVVDKEEHIDVIAASAGSGPAYYLQFIEHLIESSIRHGLNKEQAKNLLVQTCLGTVQMILQSDKDLQTLRENVTSKKGITAEALKVFADFNLGEIVDKAIQANIDRSKELSKEFQMQLM